MFLTIHSSAGLFIGSQVPLPWLAFLLGVVSHLILDTIPHGDEGLGKNWSGKEKIIKLALIVVVDLIGVAALSVYLLNYDFISLTPSILAALIGSISPDFIWGFHEVTKGKISGWISSKILNWFHFLIPYHISLKTGIFVQLTTMALFIFLLIN